ncbi:MAG: transmembrane protein [Candidatus Magnetoglobus multicellularis str. Araruama]|uniref:Transmembrane protein n=1 Tax=Candidatus Magnetoglobus multicellularis str. Araruama TaxID=890399 RepID=A0A1V1PD23_9BACT|nr:MAG: transmembrane protein [Candidatus Magnetoglobus multicellularis str. Araruama]
MVLIHTFLVFTISIETSVDASSKEYIYKAGFLEKFSRFTQWDIQSHDLDQSKNFVIAVIGHNPFGGILKKMYQKQTIKNKPVKVIYISQISEIETCHLLFISESCAPKLAKILSSLKNKPILTVSDSEGFAQKGVHINFFLTQRGTLHFEINIKRIKAAGLRVNPLLLEVARVIQ